MAATDLFDACAELLAACEAAVATTPGGAITRAYVSPGLPALDCCPLLTVSAGGPAEGDTAPLSPPLSPGQRPNVQGSVHLVNLTVTVVRCVPEEVGPDGLVAAADLETAANQTTSDVWAIWHRVRRAYQDGLLFADSGSRRRELFFDPAVPIEIAGGCAGWRIPFRVQLGGYR